MRYFILAISIFALGCADPPAEEETCDYYSNGSSESNTTVVSIHAPLAEGTVQIGCTKGTLEPAGACLESPTCSKATFSVLPVLRTHSAPMTISSGDRSTLVTADWSFLTSYQDLTEGIQELRLILMNDIRDNSCFVFPASATTVAKGEVSASIGPALTFEPCGLFR